MILVVVSSSLTPSYHSHLTQTPAMGGWQGQPRWSAIACLALPQPSEYVTTLLRSVSGRLLQAVDFPRKVEVGSAGIGLATSQRHRSDLPLSYGSHWAR